MYLSPQLARSRGGTYQLGAALARSPRSRRLARLSAISPDQAAQTAMPLKTISSKAGFTQAVYNGIAADAASGQFTNFTQPCGSTAAVSLKPVITTVAGGLMLKAASMTAAIPPLAIALAIGGGLAEVFGALFGAHAAAVKKEQQVECAAVPAANDALIAIDQAVQAGTITPQAGISGLQNLQAQFNQQIASIVKNNSSQCNAGCVWMKSLQAIVAEKSSQYQDMITAAAAAPGGAVLSPISSAIASAGLPSWVLPAGAFLLLWKLL